LQFFPHAEGYVRVTTVGINPTNPQYSYNYAYNYTDHLGNVRLTYAKDPQSGNLKVMEENHYYPFGLKHQNYTSAASLDFQEQLAAWGVILAPVSNNPFKYKYNGKELQDELGLGLYDYGARNYDPAVGRWNVIDPLAEKFYGASPYNYVGNDPIGEADMDGRDFRIDVIRDKDNNITGLKFSGTVYIQGSGASKERASELNKDFDKKYGGSIKVDGIDVSVDVNYVYDEGKKQGDLKGDENLLNFSAEDDTSFVQGNTGRIFNSGESNRTIFHESFHFMGLSDRYDDFRKCNGCFNQNTRPNVGFEDDIMGSDSFKLSKIHYENWVKHAQQRAKSYYGPIKGSPFNPMSNRSESYIESKKVDTNSKGQLQDKKGNWYKRVDYGE